MKKLLVLLALVSTNGMCDAREARCLAEIIHAEDRANIDGAIQVANAAINRRDRQRRSLCVITGVKRRPLKHDLLPYFLALANAALASPRLNPADSWDRGTKPHLDGTVYAYKGGQVFYALR